MVKRLEGRCDAEITGRRFQKSGRAFRCAHPFSDVGNFRADRLLCDSWGLLTPAEPLEQFLRCFCGFVPLMEESGVRSQEEKPRRAFPVF